LKQRQPTWVVMTTTLKGEEEARAGTLAKVLSNLSGIEIEDIYVPVLRGGSSKATFLVEGYIFVKSGYPTTKYYDISRSIFIETMISRYDRNSDMISQGTILDSELKEMVKEAYSLGGRYKEGDFVEIVEGDFKGCEGEIMTVISDGDGLGGCFYSILLKLRSAEVVVTVDVFSVGDFNG